MRFLGLRLETPDREETLPSAIRRSDSLIDDAQENSMYRRTFEGSVVLTLFGCSLDYSGY